MPNNNKSLESWIWDAACSIRGAKDAAKFKDYILPLIFVKRLCDVFDDEVDRVGKKMGSRTKALQLIDKDHELVRFYIPIRLVNPETEPTWNVIRKITTEVGQNLTTIFRDIARENQRLQGIIDRVDFNATTHGERDLGDNYLIKLVEEISKKRLGLLDVEPDIIGRSYEYLIRKFAEGSGQSAGEFYTPKEVGIIMAKIMDPEPGMEIYDPCCGSAGLLIKCQLTLEEKMKARGVEKYNPLKLYGQEFMGNTWAMANMNMVIHDMEGKIEIGDTMRNPKFREGNRLKTFDRLVANPMWNQTGFEEKAYTDDELDRFPSGAGYPGSKADWGWLQHIMASLNENGRAAVVLDTGAASRGSGNVSSNKEKEVRKWFVDNDLIEGVIYLPENLFYNTNAPGILIFLNRNKKEQNRTFLVNAANEFEKGDPKNYITENGIEKISKVFIKKEEIKRFSKFINIDEIIKNDYNISPSRYIQINGKAIYRPLNEIIDELIGLEKESADIDKKLKNILDNLKY